MVMTIKLVRVDNRGREREAPLGELGRPTALTSARTKRSRSHKEEEIEDQSSKITFLGPRLKNRNIIHILTIFL